MKNELLKESTSKRNQAHTYIIGVLLLVSSTGVTAQNKWNLTFRPGVNLAVKDLGNAKLKTGGGFEATIGYQFMPHLGAYTGWGWNKFASGNSFAGTDAGFEETGYCFGLQFFHPIGNSRINWMASGGAVYKHIETENTKGEIISDSGHGWGWEVEGGVSIPLGRRWNFVPGIRYRSLSRDIKNGTVATPVDLQYISVGAGLSWKF
jgi:hypothetical protein